MKRLMLVLLAVLMMVALAGCTNGAEEEPIAEKPVIYLYPQQPMEVFVQLDFNGELMFTYPEYNDGWEVTAYPDGTIISGGEEYSYLFWEGYSEAEYDLSEGFVVRGEDTEEFLVETLRHLGLAPKEYNEFIVYWLPRMMHNPYNLITFQNEAYTDGAQLNITPAPDSVLRVFMVFKALDEEIEIEPQQLDTFERSGFVVVEWGGLEVVG